MKKQENRCVLFCQCGKIHKGLDWVIPSIDLAGFIREMQSRELVKFTFVKMTCPECFTTKTEARREALKEEECLQK